MLTWQYTSTFWTPPKKIGGRVIIAMSQVYKSMYECKLNHKPHIEYIRDFSFDLKRGNSSHDTCMRILEPNCKMT